MERKAVFWVVDIESFLCGGKSFSSQSGVGRRHNKKKKKALTNAALRGGGKALKAAEIVVFSLRFISSVEKCAKTGPLESVEFITKAGGFDPGFGRGAKN